MAIIGIDLGTTNSLVSYWDGSKPALIPNVFGTYLTPSVVSVDQDDKLLVGQVAKERLVTHAGSTAASFKRFMGTEKSYVLGNHVMTPVELSSLVLRSLKADAEAFLNEPITEAIISVPAYFNEHQRQATITAGRLAGLTVNKLITEPTAAAIAYGLHQRDQESTFAVLDLGGGTFDVSILGMFEGVMEVRSIAGDVFLGGEDFTESISNQLLLQMGLERKHLSTLTQGQLYMQAENCKKTLSESECYEASLTHEGQVYTAVFNRTHFEACVQPLIVKLRAPIERAMRDARLKSSDLSTIVLIGGATRMQLIKSVVSRMFGQLPFTHIHPDEAVALGIAVQIALRERHEEISEMVMTDVCPFTLGIGIMKELDGKGNFRDCFSPIIERNTTIPCSRVETFCTIQDQQRHINVSIYQGESLDVTNNLLLGKFDVPVPIDKAGKQLVDIRFTYDVNGLLEVEAKVKSSGKVIRHLVEKSPGSMSPEEIEERFKRLSHLKIHPRDQQEVQLILARGNRLYEEALGYQRELISHQLLQFEKALESQDQKMVKEAQVQLIEFFEQVEGWFDWS